MSASPVSTSRARPRRGYGAHTSFTSSSRTRSAEMISIRPAIARHRLDDRGVDGEAELRGEPGGPHHPQRVVGERVLRPARRAQHPVREVDDPAVRVLEVAARQPHRHRVHREVAAPEVAGEGVAEVDGRLAGVRVVVLGAVRRDLDLPVALAAADRAERAAHVPDRVRPALEQLLGLLGSRGGREVEVVVLPAEHRVTHRTAHQRQLVTGRDEASAEVVDHRRDPVQLGRHGALDVGHLERRGRGVGHGRQL